MDDLPRSIKVVFWILFGILGASYGLEFLVHWSENISWIDIPLHTLGGMWAALLFFGVFGYLFEERVLSHSLERVKIVFIAMSFAAFIGVLWEFHEFIFSEYLSLYLQPGILDTLGDLFWDIIGGAIGALLVFRLNKKAQLEEEATEFVQNQNLPI